MLIFIAHAPKFPLNAHADKSSGARSLNFGLNLHLGTLRMGVANALARRCGCAGSPELAHLQYMISTKITYKIIL